MAKDDLQSQLELQQSINRAIQERAGLINKATQELSAQVQMQRELCAAMECRELEDSTARMQDLNGALAENRQAIDDSSDATGRLNAELKDTGSLGAAAKGALVGAFVGIKNAIGTAWDALSSLTSGIMSLPGSIFRIGGAILGAWGDMTGGLMDMAQSGGGGGKPILDSLEKVRASFGDLSGPTSASVVKSWKNLRKEGGQLAAGGASMSKIFGPGKEGVAASLDFMRESAEALGPVFHTMSEQIENAGVQLLLTRKGLGVTDEALQDVARNARTTGVDFDDALDEMNRSAAYLSKTFGISAKAIGKNFSEMQADIGTFGDYTRVEMMGVAAAMAKVGMSMKDLQGITGKTDDFESAANAVAGLSEAFGMQLDTMELMTADPAKKAEMLRDAFHDAGRSFEDMSRQEKAHLADLSEMDQKALEGLLDPSNAAMSFDDFQDAAKDGADGAITQAEANKLLTKSIEKLNKTMGGMQSTDGFFGTFMEGVKKGISRSPEFIDLMKDIRESMRIVYDSGKRVGKMLMELFAPTGPLYPVMKIFKEYFSPQNWTRRMQGVDAAFRTFTDMMKTGPRKALAGLLKDLKAVFLDGDGGQFGQILKEGFNVAIEIIGSMILGAIPTLLGWIRDGLKMLMLLLKGETDLSTDFFDDVAFPMLMDSWKMLVKEAGPILKEIGDMLMLMLEMFWDKYGAKITMVLSGILAALMVASLIKAAASAAVGAAVGAAMKGLMGMIGGAAKKLTPGGGGGQGETEAAVVENSKNMIEKLSALKPSQIKSATKKAAQLAAFILLGIVAFAAAFWVAAQIVSTISVTDVIKTGVVVGMAVMAVVAVAAALKLAEKTRPASMKKKLIQMVIVVAALGLVGAALLVAISMTPEVGVGKVLAWGFVMAAGISSAIMAMAAAAVITKLKLNMGNVIKGLLVLGVVMLGLGVLGAILVAMLKDAGTSDQLIAVGALMTALAVLFGVIALTLPVAAAIGLLLAASPWGLLGVALIVGGYAILGALAIGMIESLIPAIKDLVKIANDIPDVGKFTAVVNAIVGIMKGVGGMMDSMAGIASALKPGPFSNSQDTMKESFAAMGTFVDSLMTPSGPIGSILDKFIALAGKTDITSEAATAIEAIASVLVAIGAIMETFSPNDKTMQLLAQATAYDPQGKRTAALIGGITGFTEVMGTAATGMIKEVSGLIKELAPLLQGQDFSKVGPLMGAIGPMLSGIAGLIKAFSPSDAAMNAIAEGDNDDTAKNLGALKSMMVAMGPQIRMFISTAGVTMKELITALQPMIASISASEVDPAAIQGVASIIGAVFGGMGEMMKFVGPIIEQVMASAKGTGATKAGQMRAMFAKITEFTTSMVTVFASLKQPLSELVTTFLGLAKGIKEPEKMKTAMEVIGSIFDTLAVMSAVFGSGGALSNIRKVPEQAGSSPLFTAISAINATVGSLFGTDITNPSPMDALIAAFESIKITNAGKLKSTAESLGVAFEGILTTANAIGTLSNMNRIPEGGAGRLVNQFKEIATAFAPTGGIPDKINEIMAGFNKITTVRSVPTATIRLANEFLTALHPLINSLTYLQTIPDQTVAKITAVKDSFVALNEFIASAGTDPALQTAIQIGTAMSGEGKVTVAHENVSINLSVLVTIEADKLADVLVTDLQYVGVGTKPIP